MRYVVEQFWVWAAVAAAIGLVTGWLSHRRKADASSGWLQAYIALAGAGAVVAYGGVVRGVAGLWVETLVLFAVAWLVGCIVGTMASRLTTPASPARNSGPRTDRSATATTGSNSPASSGCDASRSITCRTTNGFARLPR